MYEMLFDRLRSTWLLERKEGQTKNARKYHLALVGGVRLCGAARGGARLCGAGWIHMVFTDIYDVFTGMYLHISVDSTKKRQNKQSNKNEAVHNRRTD